VVSRPRRHELTTHAEFELRGVRDDVVGREFVAAWRQVKVDFDEFVLQALAALGLRFTIDPSHASTIIMGTYENALREALVEHRPIDMKLLKETLPVVLLAVTAPA
jgi:hypothetical protein